MPVLKNYLANLPHTHLPWAETDAGKREVWGHGSDKRQSQLTTQCVTALREASDPRLGV